MQKNILVIGIDDFNLSELSSLTLNQNYHFIPLFNAHYPVMSTIIT